MTKRNVLVLLSPILVIAALIVANGFHIPERSAPEPDGTGIERATITHGRLLYSGHCASCHGENLEGEPNWRTRKPNGRLPAPPHDETGHTWHHSDEMLFNLTKYGMAATIDADGYESDMPAFEHTLSDKEIEAVLAFIKDSWPADVQTTQERLNEKR
ncbi:cytochrome c [Pacificimonas sp. WHA3]|uniref:Cytochrome c n=1 Tax=Pacificimonas pallii TaxID=2827236 RepID=A0ABS6SF09_9SPHN|nr:cytochrome c [Pacificimonas pallii]MBV7256979.1 cytochrome c [Pacificimonas pallii]